MNTLFLTSSLLSIAAFFIVYIAVYIYSKKHSDNERKLTTHLTWCVMTVVASLFWFFPYFWQFENAENNCLKALKSFGSALQSTICIFAVDDGYSDITAQIAELGLPAPLFQLYATIGIFLFLLAPILTFGFILSLFKNIHAYTKYYSYFGKEVHIFSELNERSLALAKSIVQPTETDASEQKEDKKLKKKHGIFKNTPLIIFADILDKNEEEHLDLVANAKDIGALLFRQDITAIRFKRKKQEMCFYLISDEEPEKTLHMQHIIEDYRNVPDTKLYIFSDSEESKCFLDSYPMEEKQNMKLEVIRVNDIRSLIYHNLDENGIRLFEHPHVCTPSECASEEREIHAVIIGFGKYGKELSKALLWYCQLPGYRLKMTVFDEHEESKNHFMAMCPEITTGSPYRKKNDMRYEIDFECCKVGTESFYQKLSKLAPITYVFVSLGEDNLNIATSMGIRSRLAKLRKYPDIETIVYNSAIKERIGVDWSEKSTSIFSDFKSCKKRLLDCVENIQSSEQKNQNAKFQTFYDAILSELEKIEKNMPELMNIYMKRELFSKREAEILAVNDKSATKIKDTCNSIIQEEEKFFAKEKLSEKLKPFIKCKQRTEMRTALKNVINEIKQLLELPYSKIHDIHIIGDLKSFYSNKTVINSNLIDDGLSCHTRYCTKEEEEAAKKTFFMNDYNFFSSVSKALHARLRKKIADKLNENDTQTKKAFSAFVPEIDADGKEIQNNTYWNRFILENTLDTAKAKNLSEAINAYEKELTKNKIEFYPYRISNQEIQAIEKLNLTCSFENNTFSFEEIVGIAKSAAEIEHIRWNAYMRSEGFSFIENFNKPFDQPLKMHVNLTPCEDLSFSDCVKDI